MVFFGLHFDVDRDGICPPEEDPGPVRPPLTKKPEGVSYVPSGRAGYINTELDTREGTASWDQYTGRTHEVQESDMKVIQDRDLDLDKYMAFKFKWSQKRPDGTFLSAAQASRELKKELGRGYGQRTAESYFSAINAAAGHSPTSQKGGRDRKSPQKDRGSLKGIEY